VAKRKKVVHLFSGAPRTSRAHAATAIRSVGASPYTAAKTVVDNFMKANPKAKRWHLLVADYAFAGRSRNTSRKSARPTVRVRRRRPHPLGERESPTTCRRPRPQADVVVMINFGGDAVAGAREIFNFGLTPKLPLIMSWSSGVEELVQLAPEIRENLWVGTNFYYTVDTRRRRIS